MPHFRALSRALPFLGLLVTVYIHAQPISVRWEKPGIAGKVVVDRGTLVSATADRGSVTERNFHLPANQPGKLDLTISRTAENAALPVLVTIEAPPRTFTFRPNEVTAAHPIYLPHDGVIITEASDARSYTDIVSAIRNRRGKTKLQAIAAAPEASFAASARTSRETKSQTWLGLSRDIRMFRVGQNLDSFQPAYAGYEFALPDVPKQPANYAFQLGRGWGPRAATTRFLDEGVLPILRGTIDDESMQYDVTMFASLERSPLTVATLRGTDFLVADRYGHGHMFTPEQAELQKQRHDEEVNRFEETVLYVRVVATNRGTAPRHALFKTAYPTLATPVSPKLPEWSFDPANGFSTYGSGLVFACSTFNGSPLAAEEMSLLLPPGGSAVLEFFVPHRPVDVNRAKALARQSFDTRLDEARSFWHAKLADASQWKLPESRIQNIVQAGLLHLDLATYGREPDQPLLPAIGIYTAIGSESAPIIQFMDSMGWHTTAERALDFFLEKQHDSGFMQNFNGYMLETGAVLWTMGEHHRYTRNERWLRRVHPNVTKAWRYLQSWRRRNLQPELKENGYGMLDGKTADPDDPFRSFMLNGYAYLGLARTAEMLRTLDPAAAAECLAEAEALKADIRTTLAATMNRSPVVPLGDGRWSRSAPPWSNYRGPVMLHADGGRWFTHGTMTARDSALGPLYLVFQEVVSPDEPMGQELLETHSELMTRDNVAFSQPYYSRHPWVHLQRGEAKAFQQAWYATVAAMADRGTYTFTEHFFPVSAHKTHEEAWFLMETRWMLYLEQGNTLKLFAGTPTDYFRPGETLSVSRAGSYFGLLSFATSVSSDGREIQVTVECPGDRKPETVDVRLPHPSGNAPASIEGGTLLPERTTVRIQNFTGHARLTVRF